MEIKHKRSKWPPGTGDYKDCIVIYDDGWNDYCYMTLFHMIYCDKKGICNPIGDVKIYYYDYDEERTKSYGKAVSEVVDNTISQLGNKFCSLGQSLRYYQKLKENCPQDYLNILKRLNDIAIFPEIKKCFINEIGVQKSLLRDSSAEKALKEASTLIKTNQLIQKNMSFGYFARVPYNDERIELQFDFEKRDDLPYRINVLIGKNGTGKTQILSSLADSLSGLSSNVFEKKEAFRGERPPVDKVISISYSAFDEFRKRVSDNNAYLSNSYIYCGIQSEHGTLSLNELNKNYLNALKIIREKERLASWRIIMQELLEKEHIALIEQMQMEDIDRIHWSSGQYILVCTMTEAVANIEKESLLLFDEPELHLHPNAVANTMRMFYRLLEEFDSYAIFATHSPLIVQEIPAQYVQILSRVNNVLTVRKPAMECFGENITNITNDIFDVSSSESAYKIILEKLSREMNFEDILTLFNGNLSFHAMIFLKSCYNKDKE